MATPLSNLPLLPSARGLPSLQPLGLKPRGTLSLTALEQGPSVPQDAILTPPVAGSCVAASPLLGSPSSRQPPMASPSPVAACLAPAALHMFKLPGSG